MCIEYCQSQKLTEALVCRFFVVSAIYKHKQLIAQMIVPDDWYHMTPNSPSSVTWFVFFSVANCCPKQTYFYQVLHRWFQETKGKGTSLGQSQVLYHTVSFTQVLQSITLYCICFILRSHPSTPPLLFLLLFSFPPSLFAVVFVVILHMSSYHVQVFPLLPWTYGILVAILMILSAMVLHLGQFYL